MEKAYSELLDQPEKLEIALRQAKELANLSAGFMTSFARHATDTQIEFDDFLAAHAFFLFKDRLATHPSGFDPVVAPEAVVPV
jgi:hypothetical protein